MKRLIVNADDFGYTPGVTRGILRAHKNGIVTSTTVMINMPYAEESLRMAREQAPDLGVGLHLNLTAGTPLSAPNLVPDLVDKNGEFLSRETLLPKLSSIDPGQLACEIQAQAQRFVELMGKPPDHLDSHHPFDVSM
jgi:chitin disaccharide deacetylase